MQAPDGFDALADVGRAAGIEPRWRRYADYCALRAKGLRAEALRALDAFIADASDWPLAERAVFAKWVARAADHRPGSATLPEPLCRRLVLPAAIDQIAFDPSDAESHLLRAALGDCPLDQYRAAVALDPTNPMISRMFVRAVLEWVDYAQHELPQGYLGVPEEDIELLGQAIASFDAAGLTAPERDMLEYRLGLACAAIAAGTPRGR